MIAAGLIVLCLAALLSWCATLGGRFGTWPGNFL